LKGFESMPLLLLVALLVQEPSVDELIRRLGADDVDERNRATHELRKRGREAVPHLRVAVGSKDAEVITRAREVLGLILEDMGNTLLRAFQDSIEAAPSVRIVSKIVPIKEPATILSTEATFLRKPLGKIRLTNQGSNGDTSWKGLLVSDGERMMLQTEARHYSQRDWGYDGKDCWPTVRAAVATIGVFHAPHIWAYVREKEIPITDLYYFGDWKDGEEGKLRFLEYSVNWRGEPTFALPNPIAAQVWYEPGTFRPTKRLLMFSKLIDGPKITEEFTYGIDVQEDAFKVPEGKQR
jgi:hypothetical protein